MCGIREWTLELDAPSVDTTSVGEKFGEAVKSLVTGGGSVDFFVDKTCCDDETGDSFVLMQLLLMTENGSKAHAEFYLVDRTGDGAGCDSGDSCGDCGALPGSLYYSTDILVTRNAINMRPTDLVAMTGNFVTTGEIKLLADSNRDPVSTDVTITSTAFDPGRGIRSDCYYDQGGCPGQNDSPQLSWNAQVKRIHRWRLRCVDTDAGDFVHWSVDNIPAATTSIAQNGAWPAGVTVNNTDWNPDPVRANGWGGPCPPGLHTYRITIDALDRSGAVIARGTTSFRAS